MADGAVRYELVSGGEFLIYREKTGNFSNFEETSRCMQVKKGRQPLEFSSEFPADRNREFARQIRELQFPDLSLAAIM